LGIGIQSKRRRSKDLFKQFIKLFKEIDVEGIAEKTKVDEFSKKLNLREHLSIMLWYVIGDCITLTEGVVRIAERDPTGEIPSDRGQQVSIIKGEQEEGLQSIRMGIL
jgi:hypothetical protein